NTKRRRHKATKRLCAFVSLCLCVSHLSPCRVYRLAHEPSGIRALLWPVFLNAAVIDFGNVKVSFLVHAESMNTPETAGEITPHAPGIKELSIEIVLQHL